MAVITTETTTEVGASTAKANGDITDNEGKEISVRGFVYGTTSQSAPGDVAPESAGYDSHIEQGQRYAPVKVQKGAQAMAAGTSAVNIDLATPVPVGKSFPIVTVRSNGNNVSRSFCLAVLQTEVDGHYTQLRLSRAFTTTTDVTYEWQVLTSDDFTVQTGEASLASLTELDVTISAVDLGETFVVHTNQTNQTGPSGGFVRTKLTSTTNLRLNVATSAATTLPVRWYVVQWRGATVQSSDISCPNGVGSADVTITEVDLTKTFILHSYYSSNGSQAGYAWTRCIFLNSTTVRMLRWFTGAYSSNEGHFYVISHPNISVQGNESLSLASATAATDSLSPAVDPARSFAPSVQQGNVTCSNTTSGQLYFAYVSNQLTDLDTMTAERSTSAADTTWAWVATVEDQLILFAEEAFNLTLPSLTPETQYYVRAYCYTEGEWSYGDEETFTTGAAVTGVRGSAIPILMEI